MTVRQFKFSRKLLLASAALGVGGGAVSAQGVPLDQVPAAPASEPSEDEALLLEEIVVVGLRASLEAGRDLKRDDVRVVDTIVAEDIAQFPQKNLSEAIQRISGVQIRRDFAGGVGNEISIRGLAPEYTQTTINGQSAPSGSDSRSFNFNVLPAELFRSVEVSKSPNASMEEGGIGGTVALQTIRPVDLRERNGVVSVEAVYNSITGETDPRATAVLGRRWGDVSGIVAGVGYSRFASASQSYDAVRWTRRDYTLAGQTFDDVWFMDLPRYINEAQDVERLSLVLSGVQELTPDLRVEADLLYVNNAQDYTRNSPIFFFNAATGLTEIEVDNGVVEYAKFNNVRFQAEDQYAQRDTDTYALTLRGIYERGPWKVTPSIGASQSDYTNDQFSYFADVSGQASYDIREDDNYFTIGSAIDISDPTSLTMRQARHFLAEVTDQAASVGVDAAYDFSDAWNFDFGFQYRDRSKERDRFEVRLNNINLPFAPTASVFTGFLEDEDAAGVNSFVISNRGAAFAAYGAGLDPRISPQLNNYYNVEEQVSSIYAMGTWEAGRWLTNFGVRAMQTDLTSTGTERNTTLGIDSAREVTSSYTDVLPSANLRLEIMPDIFFRAAAARVLTRPNLANLAAYRTINDVTRSISASNPELDPFRANQADVAVEWYFGEGGLLGLGAFHKDIESFIATRSSSVEFNGESYTLTQPVNGNEATISGLEINYQQAFDFLPGLWGNFGTAANYTYTDSSFQDTLGGTDISYGLPESSKDTYNLTLYYEDERLTARLAHNFRGRFLREIPNPVDGLKYRDDYGQTDVSIRYNLLPNLQLTMDVINAFDDKQEEYVFSRQLTDGIFTTGRTWQFGLRSNF